MLEVCVSSQFLYSVVAVHGPHSIVLGSTGSLAVLQDTCILLYSFLDSLFLASDDTLDSVHLVEIAPTVRRPHFLAESTLL